MIMFYRYRDVMDGEVTRIVLEKFVSIKETPRGHWIVRDCVHRDMVSSDRYWNSEYDKKQYIDNRKKWVSVHTQKRFAYPTKVEAMNNFMARKKIQLKLLKRKLESVEEAVEKGKKLKKELFEEIFEPGYFTKDERTASGDLR